MTGGRDPIPVALLVASIFARLGVPYWIGGSVASTVHGEPRATMDADFAAHLDPPLIEPLVSALAERCFVDVDDIRDAVGRQRAFNAIHEASFFKVDAHVRPRSGHSAEEMRRAQRVRPLARGVGALGDAGGHAPAQALGALRPKEPATESKAHAGAPRACAALQQGPQLRDALGELSRPARMHGDTTLRDGLRRGDS